MAQLTVIGARELRQLVPISDAIRAVRAAFLSVSNGQAELPLRVAMAHGRLLGMFARVGPDDGGCAIKVVSVHTDNPERGLPTIHGVVLWFDGETGAPTAMLEGTAVTALRTGAASAVATDLLAPADAKVMAVIGAGAQAPDQVRAVAMVRHLRQVRIASRRPESRRLLAELLRPELPHTEVVVCEDVQQAVGGADIVSTVTTATAPLFELGDLPDTLHVNAVGAYRPEMRELPADLLRDAQVVAVDQMAAAREEAGDIIQAVAEGKLAADKPVEIGALLASPPPLSPRRRTVFKSVGIAAQDWAIAHLAVERARDVSPGPAQVQLS